MSKKKNDDLFKQSLMSAVDKARLNVDNRAVELDKKTNSMDNKNDSNDDDIDVSDVKDFSDVEELMKTKFARRIVKIMAESSDRNFVSYYFKFAEYVMPKRQRVENEIENKPNKIKVEVVDSKDYDKELIDKILKNKDKDKKDE